MLFCPICNFIVFELIDFIFIKPDHDLIYKVICVTINYKIKLS